MGEKLSPSDRRELILEEAGRLSSVKLSDLASRYGVSRETIRRDLEYLGKEGLLTRTLGGAVEPPNADDLGFQARMRQNVAKRTRIADHASEMVHPGEFLFIGSGVTALHFSRSLRRKAKNLTILTGSIRVANALVGAPGCRIILAPGELDGAEQITLGHEASAFFRRYRADSMYFGVSGISEDGLFETRSDVAWTIRSMLENANRAVLLSDSENFGRTSFNHLCPLGRIDTLVTEESPSEVLGDVLEKANVTVVVANDH